MEDKASLLALDVTDLLRAVPYEPQPMDRGNPTEGLALDRAELEEILGRQYFIEMEKSNPFYQPARKRGSGGGCRSQAAE